MSEWVSGWFSQPVREWANKNDRLLCHSGSKWLTVMLSEQYFAFVILGHLCTYSTCVGFECLCVFLCECVCAYLCIRLSGLSSTPNGLMGTPWCLSSPPERGTLRVWGSTKAQPCLRRGVSLWRGATAVLTVAGLMVITLPRGSVLWALRPRTSPLHTLLLRLNRGPKRTPVDHPLR